MNRTFVSVLRSGGNPALKVPLKPPSENLDDWEDVEELREMMQKELPLWSVVDSFSLGLLSHAVVQSYASGTIPESGDAEKLLLYKKTAERMGVNQ